MNAISGAMSGMNAAHACGSSSSSNFGDRMLDHLMSRLDEEGKGSSGLRAQLEQAVASATETAEASGASRRELMQQVRAAVDDVLEQNGIDPPSPPEGGPPGPPPGGPPTAAATNGEQSILERLLAMLGIDAESSAQQDAASGDSLLSTDHRAAETVNLLA